jgi:hypothetical protein
MESIFTTTANELSAAYAKGNAIANNKLYDELIRLVNNELSKAIGAFEKGEIRTVVVKPHLDKDRDQEVVNRVLEALKKENFKAKILWSEGAGQSTLEIAP